MARKHHAKHSKKTILASASAHSFSKLSVGAAGAVAAASLALSAAPALAQTGTAPATEQQAAPTPAGKVNNKDVTATSVKKADTANSLKKTDTVKNEDVKKEQVGGGNLGKAPQKNTTVQEVASSKGFDRAATPAPAPKVNSEITLSKETKDTLPNMYAWGKSDNVYIESGQNQEVTFKFEKPSDGSTITKVAIFPNDNIDIKNKNAKGFVEYYSADGDWHQAYSGKYAFTTSNDGSATLKMTHLYRDNKMPAAGYSAMRCIYVYGMKDGQEVLLYKTNIVRAATLIPPKTTGSIVLRYDQKLEDNTIREKLQQALDAPTELKDKNMSKPLSVRDQITAASTVNGVGVRKEESKPVVNTPDTAENKVIINAEQAYDAGQVNSINTVTSKPDAKVTTYKTGVVNLKTYLVSDLGYKSEALPLTIARYDTRIDKPTVEDPTKVSQEVKTDIIKKLARLNHVSEDKVSINDKGEVSINFDGVDPKDAPKIALRDLVLKKFKEDQIKVPANDKATVIYNPIGYSKAELTRIKQSILDANKDNKDLGLISTDQIALEYIAGDTVTSGHNTQGISNGQQENKITVKIKTDKAYAEFTSDVKTGKLTRLVDIRKDYNVSWEQGKNKLDGRDSDEGLSWSNENNHTTIIYRYDPTAAKELKTDDIIKLLKATPKDQQAGLRNLTGGEQLDHEDTNGKPRKSHMKYALQGDEPTGELSLGNMSGAYWIGNQKVSHSDEKLGDDQSVAGSYSWDKEAGSVTVAGKKDKIYKARLFVQPYAMTYYKDVYLEQGRNPGNTAKAINIIFVPQTNHKTQDLKDSIGEHKLAADMKTPTESKYYNASKDKKDAYDEALKEANAALEAAGNTEDSKLTEALKARIDNATINLNKARAELDGDKTNKDALKSSIEENGKAAEGQQAATGTQATNQFKNVSDPDFKTPDGKPDTKKNEAAKKAKEAYDNALKAAEAARDNDNATQKAVDDAKAELDKARKALNDYTTNKDELSAVIADYGKVNTGDATKTDPAEKLKTADPTYQNSSKDERDAYDKAVAEADKVSKDPNASQKEVNDAIKKLKDAKAALDANATDKSPLDAAVQKSFDNPDPTKPDKQSVFYKNAKNKTGDPAAQQAVQNYDDALKKAKEVLANDKATKKDVEDAKKALENAETALHADTYATDNKSLGEALADNFSGYLMPAYFNAFDKAQAEGKDSQAAKDFKAYNDAYHAAKELMAKTKQQGSNVTQDEVDQVKTQLLAARKVIDTYATDTSKLSAALLHSLAIKASPAYQNASATDASEDAKKAKKAYDEALEKLQKAFNDQLPQDTVDGKPGGQPIPTDNVPAKDGNADSPDYLKNVQSHAKGQPLNRDVTSILAELNKAQADLSKFATKTDELIKSINEHDNTKQTPAYKNASQPNYQKADGSGADDDKNDAAREAANDYGEALNKAKDLLKNPSATQKEVNDALKTLNEKRAALNTYNTDTTKLKASVEKHGTKAEVPAPKEGTLTSDAYRNASDPHFMKEQDGKLVPDDDKNKKAAEDKKAYDAALLKAQELLTKADPDSNTPLDAQPTQKEIDDALKTLDEARKKLEDNYKTVTTDLEAETRKSTPEHAPAATGDEFENTPEFKNAKAKTSDGQTNADVAAYQKALKKARDLVTAAVDQDKKNSERPTQQQINDALDALKAAKKQITDNYQTNIASLKDISAFANGDFKKTPEYKNAAALKDDDKADQSKKQAAKGVVDALDENVDKSALKKAKAILDKFDDNGKPKAGVTDIPTQAQVNKALKTLQDAMDKVTDNYKTDVKLLTNEVGDKDAQGKPVVPPFEASVPYKNALEKAKTETGADAEADTSATKKLKAYADKLQAAQDLINKVKNPDPNAAPADRPTQKQVDEALAALKQAKKDIDEKFKTKVDKLQNEVDDKDESGTARTPKFEESTEFANLKGKTKDGKKSDDLVAYEQALAKAKELIDKNDGKVTKDGQEVDVPKDQLPTQQEVDEAQKALKEIKDKILANYKTNPHDLYEEFDQSKDADDDTRDGLFEDTPEFKNADAKKGEGGKDNADMAAYKAALDTAKKLLDKFDRTTGKPKTNLPAGEKAPTQKQLDDALDALQAAKKKITDGYKTDPSKLKSETDADGDFTKTPEYQNAQAKGDDASKQALEDYKKALEDANKVLGDKDATQAQVDEALKKLQDAKSKLTDGYKTDTSGLVADVDAAVDVDNKDYRNASREAQEAYDKALAAARAILKNPKATQAEIDAAQRALMLASDALMKSAHRPKLAPQQPARTNAPKHLAATSDPTNTFAVMGMITSAFGLIFAGAKRKRQRRQ